MSPQFWPRMGGTFALGLVALAADRAPAAEPPAPLPVLPAVHTEPAAAPPPQPEIERFHGTVRVNPMTPPAPPAPAMRPPAVEMVPPPEPPVVQVEARAPVVPAPVAPDTRVSDAVVDTLATVRDDTRRVSTAAAVLLGQVGTWMKAPAAPSAPAEPRAIFPITVSVPAPVVPPQPAYYPQVPPWAVAVPGTLPTFPPHAVAPVSAAVTQPAAPIQPTIIVVREPAPPAPLQVVAAPVAPAPVEAARPAFAPESLLGFGVGALGLGVGLMGWLRTNRKKKAEAGAAAAVELPSPAQRPQDGIVLSNGMYAGPRPELAEKFDLGPSYHDEQEQKKQQEAENQTAVLEFILAQNLALQAAFAGPAADAPAAPAAE
ncbi:unnamed protein product [Gemmataceae bacterium]|nr:unnamed protein product [Gemmataceae bacterium]VTT99721.1 unnamed protein product [Gemmataceae bacterium]